MGARNRLPMTAEHLPPFTGNDLKPSTSRVASVFRAAVAMTTTGITHQLFSPCDNNGKIQIWLISWWDWVYIKPGTCTASAERELRLLVLRAEDLCFSGEVN